MSTHQTKCHDVVFFVVKTYMKRVILPLSDVVPLKKTAFHFAVFGTFSLPYPPPSPTSLSPFGAGTSSSLLMLLSLPLKRAAPFCLLPFSLLLPFRSLIPRPYYSSSFYTGGGRAKRPSHTSQRSAAPAVAAKIVAGAMAATGVRAAAAAGLGNRRWRRW